MLNILFCEDEKDLNEFVTEQLTQEGFCVFSCFDGKQGYDTYADNKIDVIISDIMMPKMDGYELCEKVRSTGGNMPIIFVSARDDKMSKQFGYRVGIDDYITKPFDIDELIFKVKAIERRLQLDEVSVLKVGNLTLDKQEHSAYISNEPVNLTVREFDILYKLLSFPKKTFTRSQLMDEFWDFDSSATSRTVDVYMAKLRDKTSECDGFSIVTVHGLGYKAVLNGK